MGIGPMLGRDGGRECLLGFLLGLKADLLLEEVQKLATGPDSAHSWGDYQLHCRVGELHPFGSPDMAGAIDACMLLLLDKSYL